MLMIVNGKIAYSDLEVIDDVNIGDDLTVGDDATFMNIAVGDSAAVDQQVTGKIMAYDWNGASDGYGFYVDAQTNSGAGAGYGLYVASGSKTYDFYNAGTSYFAGAVSIASLLVPGDSAFGPSAALATNTIIKVMTEDHNSASDGYGIYVDAQTNSGAGAGYGLYVASGSKTRDFYNAGASTLVGAVSITGALTQTADSAFGPGAAVGTNTILKIMAEDHNSASDGYGLHIAAQSNSGAGLAYGAKIEGTGSFSALEVVGEQTRGVDVEMNGPGIGVYVGSTIDTTSGLSGVNVSLTNTPTSPSSGNLTGVSATVVARGGQDNQNMDLKAGYFKAEQSHYGGTVTVENVYGLYVESSSGTDNVDSVQCGMYIHMVAAETSVPVVYGIEMDFITYALTGGGDVIGIYSHALDADGEVLVALSSFTGIKLVYDLGDITNDVVGIDIDLNQVGGATVGGDLYGLKIDTSGFSGSTVSGGENYGIYVDVPNVATDYGIYVTCAGDYGLYVAAGTTGIYNATTLVNVGDSAMGPSAAVGTNTILKIMAEDHNSADPGYGLYMDAQTNSSSGAGYGLYVASGSKTYDLYNAGTTHFVGAVTADVVGGGTSVYIGNTGLDSTQSAKLLELEYVNDPTSASSGDVWGIYGVLTVGGAQNNMGMDVKGIDVLAQTYDTAGIRTLTGLYIRSIAYGDSVSGSGGVVGAQIQASGNATTGSMTGIDLTCAPDGDVSHDVIGLKLTVFGSSGTLSGDVYGIKVTSNFNQAGGGQNYGIYVSVPNVATDYGIYVTCAGDYGLYVAAGTTGIYNATTLVNVGDSAFGPSAAVGTNTILKIMAEDHNSASAGYGLYVDAQTNSSSGAGYGLYVAGDHKTNSIYVDAIAGTSVYIVDTSLATTSIVTGLRVELTNDPASPSSNSTYGIYSDVYMGGSQINTGNVYGGVFEAGLVDTASAAEVTGASMLSTISAGTDVTGSLFGAYISSACYGTAGNQYALSLNIINSGASIDSDLCGIQIEMFADSGGTIGGDLYGIKVDSSAVSDTVSGGQNYGIYVSVPNLTTDYGIYVTCAGDYGLYVAAGTTGIYNATTLVNVGDSAMGPSAAVGTNTILKIMAEDHNSASDGYGLYVDAQTNSGAGDGHGIYVADGSKYGLYVAGGSTNAIYVDAIAGTSVYIYNNALATTSPVYGLYMGLTNDPGTPASSNLHGAMISVSQGGSQVNTNTVRGLAVSAGLEDTASCNTLMGMSSEASVYDGQDATSKVVSGYFRTVVYSGTTANTAGSLYGIEVLSGLMSEESTVTIDNDVILGYFYHQYDGNGTTITGDSYGLKVDLSTLTAVTVSGGQNYGIYVSVPNLTTDYGIYVTCSGDYGLYVAAGTTGIYNATTLVNVGDSAMGPSAAVGTNTILKIMAEDHNDASAGYGIYVDAQTNSGAGAGYGLYVASGSKTYDLYNAGTSYLGNDVTLAAGSTLALTGDSSDLELEEDLSADGTYSGITATVTIDTGASPAFGSGLHMDTDGEYVDSDADAAATMPIEALALGSGTGAQKVLLYGYIREDDWNWTIGGLIYADTTTGALSQTAPSDSGDQVQIVGYAVTADIMFFNPNYSLVEVA